MVLSSSPLAYVDQLRIGEDGGVQAMRFEIEYGHAHADITILPAEPITPDDVRREFERLATALNAAVYSSARIIWQFKR
jgi:hypothetical protein